MFSDVDEAHAYCMVVYFQVHTFVQQSVSKFGMINRSSANLYRLYRLMYMQPL